MNELNWKYPVLPFAVSNTLAFNTGETLIAPDVILAFNVVPSLSSKLNSLVSPSSSGNKPALIALTPAWVLSFTKSTPFTLSNFAPRETFASAAGESG